MGRRAVVDLALVREREGSWSEHRTDVMGEVKVLIGFIAVGKIFDMAYVGTWGSLRTPTLLPASHARRSGSERGSAEGP